ncbi:MAG TPA: glycosyltransferase [Lacipirellulaceae bacterium]|nr:glycosyltransferase [Lacipirellulaceae bacterium]
MTIELTQSAQQSETIVVVPCFNEARRLDVPAFVHFLERWPQVTLVFVDDGSTDDTPLVLERLRQRCTRQVCTLRLGSNAGKGEAVRRGMQVALRRRPTFVGYWDADLAAPLDALAQLQEVLQARPEVLLVMGSRVALLGRDIRRNVCRHFIGRAFATAASLALKLPVYDTQCGAKLFRVTPSFTELISRPFQSRWIFDLEILARMIADSRVDGKASISGAIHEYPLDAWRDVRGSRLKPIDFLTAGLDLAAIFWRQRRHRTRMSPADGPPRLPHPASPTLNRGAA